MDKKRSVGVTVISAMGLLAACLGLVGFPIPFFAFGEIIDAFYVCNQWRFYIFSIGEFIIAVIIISCNCAYILSSIGIYLLKSWARRVTFFVAPISAILTVIISQTSIHPMNTPEAIRYASIMTGLAFLSALYAVTSTIVILRYLTRPKVKEQFK